MNSNESIKSSIRKIISSGNVDSVDYIECYVSNVYPEGDEDYGTIDVISTQEKALIKNVSLSAIAESNRGDFKLPTLLSEVTIAVVNGATSYVVLFSHLDTERIDVNELARIGATGHEEPDDDTDYDEVEKTGLESFTEYRPDSIDTKAIDSSPGEGSEKINHINMTASKSESTLTDNSSSKSTKVIQTPTSVKIEAGSNYIEQTESGLGIKSPAISLDNGGLTEEAVLGQKLKLVLSAMITQMGLITTATSMGPQPLLNKVAVDALQNQLDTIMSQVVKIQ